MPETLIISTGATGGHIFPAIVVANFAKKTGLQVKILMSSPRIDLDLDNFEVHMIPSAPVTGKRANLAINLLKNFAGTIKSMPMTMRLKNSGVLLATGAFPSVPPVISAILSGMNFYLMEQNVVPGAAVKTFAGKAKAVFVSFPETESYLEGARVIFTGNPVRDLRFYPDARKYVGVPEGMKIVLVLGGSQGALKLAETGIQLSKIMKDVFFFIQCGKVNLEYFKSVGLTGENYKVEPFFRDMGLMYSLADVVVSRAGAGTIFEVMKFGKPLVLVPLQLAHGHQIENARSLERRGAAKVLLEDDLTPHTLKNMITEVLYKESEKMIQAQREFAPEKPEEKIVKTILEDAQ